MDSGRIFEATKQKDMKTFDDLLTELDACEDAVRWAKGKTIETVVATVDRGDWLLWLAKKIDIPIRPLTLAKARCAKTVIHLMTDQRSIDAVNLAEKFGLTDEVSEDELSAAGDAAYVAAYATPTNVAYVAAYVAAYATANGAYVAYATADATAYATANAAADAADAWLKNQLQTADICRETIGAIIIDKVKTLING